MQAGGHERLQQRTNQGARNLMAHGTMLEKIMCQVAARLGHAEPVAAPESDTRMAATAKPSESDSLCCAGVHDAGAAVFTPVRQCTSSPWPSACGPTPWLPA